MSYSIHLACVRGRDTLRFKREIFEEIFLPHCSNLKSYKADPSLMQVEYTDGSRSDIYVHNTSDEEEQARRQARTPEKVLRLPSFPPGDPAYIEHLGFDHFGGDAFFQDLYRLADLTGAMIYAAANEPTVIVTRESVLEKIPEDFLGMENARVVHSAAELEDAVFGG